MEKVWGAHPQVGVQFKLPAGLVAFCKYLREQRQDYELAGDNTVILTGQQLDQLVAQRIGVLKDHKHEFHLVVPFSKLSEEAKLRAVRHRLLLDASGKRSH